MKKVRIVYNKQYLPTAIEGYFKFPGDKKAAWHSINEYSYPYTSPTLYNHDLNCFIDKIKDGYFETK